MMYNAWYWWYRDLDNGCIRVVYADHKPPGVEGGPFDEEAYAYDDACKTLLRELTTEEEDTEVWTPRPNEPLWAVRFDLILKDDFASFSTTNIDYWDPEEQSWWDARIKVHSETPREGHQMASFIASILNQKESLKGNR